MIKNEDQWLPHTCVQGMKQIRCEFEALKMQLSEEVVRVAKYRRMASEVSQIINAVQVGCRPVSARLSPAPCVQWGPTAASAATARVKTAGEGCVC